ncbi:MAG: hypothetical protein WAU24_06465 [Chitinophagaceae bacterium]
MKYIQLLFAASFILVLSSCTDIGKKANDIKDTADMAIAPQVDNTKVIPDDTLTKEVTTAEQFRVAGFNDPPGFRKFFSTFQNWVATNNTDSIAAHIQFPLKNCSSASAFKKDYKNLFNDQVKSSVAAQDANHFFANQQGLMTGNGEVWFNEINGKYLIIAINNKSLK